MQSIVSTLLMTCILLCPYQCAVSAAFVARSEVKDKACCERCRAKQDSQPSSEHQEPKSDDTSRGCFCKGSLFDVAARQAFDDSMQPTWVAIFDDLLLSGRRCVGEHVGADDILLLTVGDGAAMRVLIQSFLI